VQGPGLGGGLGAELLGEGLAEPLVGGQGGGRLAGGGVGEHGGPPGGLVEGVGGVGGAGVGQGAGGVADGQGGVAGEAPGPCGQALGLAPGREGPVGVGLVGQERAPPEQGQGALGGGQGQGRLGAEAGLGLTGQPLRLVQVDLGPRPGHEPPALAVAGDRLGPEHGPQPAHQRGQVGVGVGGRPPVPQGLDEHVGRDDPAPPGQQQLQQGAALAAGQLVGRHLAAVHGDAEHAQDPHAEVGLATHERIVGDCSRQWPGPQPGCKPSRDDPWVSPAHLRGGSHHGHR
jgi:hypothetical protein